jgi:thiamine-monophosphate kinase
MQGVGHACRAVGAGLLGGDLTRSTGPVVVTVTVIGHAQRPVLRSGARSGDEVWVTGCLGGAGAALDLLSAGGVVPASLRSAFVHPSARTREALWLDARCELHAMIDLSDGLAGDAGHVAAASEISIEIDSAAVPVFAEAVKATNAARAHDQALYTGEDYELLVIAGPGSVGRVEADFVSAFGVPLTRIGRVREGRGVWLAEGGALRALKGGGYDHFALQGR